MSTQSTIWYQLFEAATSARFLRQTITINMPPLEESRVEKKLKGNCQSEKWDPMKRHRKNSYLFSFTDIGNQMQPKHYLSSEPLAQVSRIKTEQLAGKPQYKSLRITNLLQHWVPTKKLLVDHQNLSKDVTQCHTAEFFKENNLSTFC